MYKRQVEHYKKKCEELEKVINMYRDNLEEMVNKRIASIETKTLEAEVAKAVAAKEKELIERYSQQNKVLQQRRCV